MPSLFAAILASAASYGLDTLMDGWFSPATSIVVSTILGIVLYAAFLWWIKRLRGE